MVRWIATCIEFCDNRRAFNGNLTCSVWYIPLRDAWCMALCPVILLVLLFKITQFVFLTFLNPNSCNQMLRIHCSELNSFSKSHLHADNRLCFAAVRSRSYTEPHSAPQGTHVPCLFCALCTLRAWHRVTCLYNALMQGVEGIIILSKEGSTIRTTLDVSPISVPTGHADSDFLIHCRWHCRVRAKRDWCSVMPSERLTRRTSISYIAKL